MIRTTIRIVLLTAAFFCMVNLTCAGADGWTSICIQNSGLDPIHIGGKRIGVGQKAEMGDFMNGTGDAYHLSRDTIDLGNVFVNSITPDKEVECPRFDGHSDWCVYHGTGGSI